MPNFSLEINAKNKPTVLERLLQTTRYRGYSIVNLSVKPSLKMDSFNILLTVNNSNKQETSVVNGYQKLSSQLAKLFDVNQIKLLENNINQPTINQQSYF